jgi:hypothetical protein
MSRFNKQKVGTKTVNLAGGEAYSQSPELELISILLTSFANNQFYEKSESKFDRIIELLKNVNPLFAAKAAIYARTEFGMRSISHVLASEIAKHVSGQKWAKSFYEKIVYRPDDMIEILSYHKKNGKLSGAMKKGFAMAFNKFDAYQLAKYRAENKQVKLIDVVNLVHPKGNESNKEALKLLVKGELKSTETWESKLSNAGKSGVNKEKAKKDAWIGLIKERKIGYFALLRNLRNIQEQAPEILKDALELLVDEKLIKKSLVLPFRFMTAIEEIKKVQSNTNDIIIGINRAIDISCDNVPIFDGETAVVVDFSGSMGLSYKEPRGKASLLGAILAKSNNSDFMIFGNHAKYINFNPMDSILTIVNYMNRLNKGWGYSNDIIGNVGNGTNFHSIFQTLNKKYERLIILSDMQGWIGYNTPVSSFNTYKNKFNADPFIYSFDLAGNGSMQFPEKNVFCLAGFSEKIFDVMKLLESDKNALISKINEIELK